jgi:small subunit ribosomal protein S6
MAGPPDQEEQGTQMKKYESLYIVPPALSTDEIKAVADKFKGIVERNGGTVERAELWEKRKLAYEIKGLREGNYIIMIFDAPPALPAELDRLMRIDDTVIRHTIGLLTPEALKAMGNSGDES